MRIIERDFFVAGSKLGTTKHYDNVNPVLIPYDKDKGVRVLPAPFFNEPRLNFTLIKRYEIGDKKIFPKGGYEIRDENGGSIRSYELDQIIIHPSVAKIKIELEGEIKTEESQKTFDNFIKKEKGKRGRKPLSSEEKAKRVVIMENKSKGSGKRGRQPLSSEERERREKEKEARRAISGGKRGRPKKL